MSENIIDKKNSTKINFLKTLGEKSLYLDEFKENVILALTKKQIMSGIIYTEDEKGRNSRYKNEKRCSS